jgi:hypothetical protein
MAEHAQHMAFIMLDHVLGEWDFSVRVGPVEFASEAAAMSTAPLCCRSSRRCSMASSASSWAAAMNSPGGQRPLAVAGSARAGCRRGCPPDILTFTTAPMPWPRAPICRTSWSGASASRASRSWTACVTPRMRWMNNSAASSAAFWPSRAWKT